MVNTELKAYGAFEQKKKLIAGIVLTGGGSNLRNLRQLANYTTGFDSRIGFANEYVANDKNQYLKGPEFATSIGLLMESLKIRDKKMLVTEEEIIEELKPQIENAIQAQTQSQEIQTPQVQNDIVEIAKHKAEVKKNRPTFGQSLMDKVKKFFEEVEE